MTAGVHWIPRDRNRAVPPSLGETWETLFENEMQNWVRLSPMADEVSSYRLREDGTPEYVMVNRMGLIRASHRSEYLVYQPRHSREDPSSRRSDDGSTS